MAPREKVATVFLTREDRIRLEIAACVLEVGVQMIIDRLVRDYLATLPAFDDFAKVARPAHGKATRARSE
jgi:hypothetical protein